MNSPWHEMGDKKPKQTLSLFCLLTDKFFLKTEE